MIDSHSHKVQTKINKIPNFGVMGASKMQPFENAKIHKEMCGHPDAVSG